MKQCKPLVQSEVELKGMVGKLIFGDMQAGHRHTDTQGYRISRYLEQHHNLRLLEK